MSCLQRTLFLKNMLVIIPKPAYLQRNLYILKPSSHHYKMRKLRGSSCVLLNGHLIGRRCSADDKKHIYEEEMLKNIIEKNKVKLRDTEIKLRQKGEDLVKDFRHQKHVTELKIKERKDIIMKDIIETKTKVKEKIEEVIEVFQLC